MAWCAGGRVQRPVWLEQREQVCWRRGRRGKKGPCEFTLSEIGTPGRALSREGQSYTRKWLSLFPGQPLSPEDRAWRYQLQDCSSEGFALPGHMERTLD